MRPLDRLSQSFLGARLKTLPPTRQVRTYDTGSARVDIVKHRDPTYYLTLRLDAWDVITLLEIDQLLARGSIRQHEVPGALRKLTRQKGLSTERRLHQAWRNTAVGFGVLEHLMDDAHVSTIHIRAVNDMVHCSLDHEEFGHCHTNIRFARSFVDKLSEKCENPLGGRSGWNIAVNKSVGALDVITISLTRMRHVLL